jgi:hypothetical protein
MVREPMTTYRKAAAAYLTAHAGALRAAGVGDGGPIQWSDAWLLHAVMLAQGDKTCATVEDIIGAGDFINHAIFTCDELAGGFRRLEQVGFLEIDGAVCKLTTAFFAAWKRAGTERRSLAKQSEALRKILGAPPWQPARPVS